MVNKPLYWTCHSLVSAAYWELLGGEVVGLNNVPQNGPCILATNHASHLDPPLSGCNLMRTMTFFARKTLWKPGVASWWLDNVGTIPVDRDGDSDIKAMKSTLKTLKDGGLLALFPEGTRSPDGSLQKAKPGIGLIAAKSQASVIPCRIFNSHKVLSKAAKLPNLSVSVHMVYGKPMPPEEYDPGKAAGKERYQKIADNIMERISAIKRPRQQIV